MHAAGRLFGKRDIITFNLIGDSTVADDYDDKDYLKSRYPMTGWGHVFQPFGSSDSLHKLGNLVEADSVVVDDRARGNRSTRTFFQEERWRNVYEALSPEDLVLIQFGHNDASENKPERYVNIEGYKEFSRLFVHQTREKGPKALWKWHGWFLSVCTNWANKKQEGESKQSPS